MPQVSVIMGSASDHDIVRPCLEVLASLGLPASLHIASAHRTPERVEHLITQAETEGAQVFICAAGMAAHLAGTVAARTVKPVIGIPVAGSSLAGMDALFSTVQMPPGFPVATVALNGARNAAWLAAQIIAVNDEKLSALLREKREEMARAVAEASQKIEAQYQEKGVTFV